MAHKTLVNGTAYDITGGKTLVSGTAYDIASGKTLVGGTAYDISFSTLPPVGTALEDCTWAQISEISAAGLGSQYFKVGDTKSLHLLGTMGTLALNYTCYVYILGFDHNGATNTIDFGGFKNTDGTSVALIDSKYGSSTYNGEKYFNMMHKGTLSKSQNYGGWKGSELRYDILGSTDVQPSHYGQVKQTWSVGYDASETTATNPVPNTLMSCLPEDLRIVMKPMTIYTDNTGNSSTSTANVTASIDYLPLLSVYEVFGVATTSSSCNLHEAEYQKQYAYYAQGIGSRVKYRHSVSTSTTYWSLRSPARTSDSFYCCVNTGGNVYTSNAQTSRGIAPIFRV